MSRYDDVGRHKLAFGTRQLTRDAITHSFIAHAISFHIAVLSYNFRVTLLPPVHPELLLGSHSAGILLALCGIR